MFAPSLHQNLTKLYLIAILGKAQLMGKPHRLLYAAYYQPRPLKHKVLSQTNLSFLAEPHDLTG